MNPNEYEDSIAAMKQKLGSYTATVRDIKRAKKLQQQLLTIASVSSSVGSSAASDLAKTLSEMEVKLEVTDARPGTLARMTEDDVMEYIRDDINANILVGDDAVLEAASKWLTRVTNEINDIVRKAGGAG